MKKAKKQLPTLDQKSLTLVVGGDIFTYWTNGGDSPAQLQGAMTSGGGTDHWPVSGAAPEPNGRYSY
jgi:hypothetical protein